MVKSFKYDFINELEYDYNGDKKIAEYIEITAPSNKQRLYTTVIECAYLNSSESSQHRLMTMMPEEKILSVINSVKNAEEIEKESEKLIENQTGQQIVNMIMSNIEAKKMNAVFDAFEMILKDSAKLDGLSKFGSALFEKMSNEDTKNMLGEYINNFFVTSRQV